MLALALRTTPPGGCTTENVMRTMLWTVMLLLAPQGAMAGQDAVPLSKMVEQQVVLRDELAKSPKDLTLRQVGLIRKAQGEFFRLVDGKSTMDQLAIEDKVRVENALETINAQFVGTNRAGADQQVCWRETTVGSKMKATRCGTQQEIDDAREGARGFLLKPKICVPPGCGA